MNARSTAIIFWGGARHSILYTLLLCACSVPVAVGAPIQSEEAASTAAHVLDRYCTGCHSGDDADGGFSLEGLDQSSPLAHHAAWEQVIRKLRHRQMPPLGKRRPDDAAYEATIAYLASKIDAGSAEKPDPGRTDTFRRLTRYEYQNAIRDILALDVDASSLLPEDDISLGFDNITVGSLSPTLLERYLAAAKEIARLAVGRPVDTPQGTIISVPIARTQADHIEGLPFGTRGGTLARHNFPVDGEYEFSLRLMRDRDEEVEGWRGPDALELMLDGALVQRFSIAAPSDELEPKDVDRHMEIRVPVTAGPHAVGAAFVRKSSAIIEGDKQPSLAHYNMDRHPRTQPALYSITIFGPFESEGVSETPSRHRVLPCNPSYPGARDACARDTIRKLMRRAYRRPITDDDLEAPMRFYAEVKEEDGFEAGIEMALRAMLTSPHFLFRIEQDPSALPAGDIYQVSDIALASRLSFFIWSSIPDDELIELAVDGKLSKPDVLEEQVRRMLADKRATALVTNFASQWLHLRNLETASPSTPLFMDFDDNLRQAMRRETELFLESVFLEDRSVLDLLRAEHTFVDERLAKHYGIPNVYGTRMRRVGLEENDARGGLLTQASILTVTSYSNRTSPILRGKWILANILGAPPEPPPPNIPLLKEHSEEGNPTTLRENIAQHRADPACAGCHNPMDPLGFALENFDATGRWRTEDGDLPVDATGTLMDGTAFDGATSLQEAILARPALFVTTLTEKLMIYALGRGVEHYDGPTIRQIVREARDSDYQFSSVILGIVKSIPFQQRRAQ